MAGPGDEDKDAASVRADCPVPFDVSLYYFEVQVVNKGRDGFVGAYYLLQLFQIPSRAEQLCVPGKIAPKPAITVLSMNASVCCA